MQIRHIGPDDWDDIVALEAGAYTENVLSEERAALQSRASSSPATCFVLDTGDGLAGYLLSLPYPVSRYPDLATAETVVFSSSNLHLHDLVIARGYRGRGLAKSLLGQLTATARAQAYERISLVAVAGSDTFWSANGYRAVAEVVLPESYGSDAVYMSTVIAEPPNREADAARGTAGRQGSYSRGEW
jgi:ribosomal protein S18 acetylase RimI-like enzyme